MASSPSPPPPTQPPPSALFAAFQALVGGPDRRVALEEALRRRRATGEGYCISCHLVRPHVNDQDTCEACAAPPAGETTVWRCTAFVPGRGTCNRAVTHNDVRSFGEAQIRTRECLFCWSRNPQSQVE